MSCEFYGQNQHHPQCQCPNCEYNIVGCCDKCGESLYEEYEIWIDNNGNRFCSEDCAKDYYGIKEIDY